MNETSFDLDSVQVKFSVIPEDENPGSVQTLRFGPIPDGGRTGYAALEGGYVYNYSFAFAFRLFNAPPGQGATLTPLFQGEEPLISVGPGRYTYRLRLESRTGPTLLAYELSPGQPDAPSDTVEVRVENRSDVAFDAVAVLVPDPDVSIRRVEFGPVAAGSASAYVSVPLLYRFVSTEAVVGADTLEFFVEDFDGEEAFPPGRYTYGLGITEGTTYRDRTEIVREGDY